MSTSSPMILVINSGSSSLKFAIYPLGERQPLASGLAERLGQSDASIRIDVDGAKNKSPLTPTNHQGAVDALMTFLKERGWCERVAAVGPRVVNGGERFTDFQQFQAMLMEHQDRLARNMIESLLVYALGRDIEFTDQPRIDQIMVQLQPTGFRMKDMIHAIAESPFFFTN